MQACNSLRLHKLVEIWRLETCRRRIEGGKFLRNVIYHVYRVSCSSASPVCNLVDYRECARSHVVHVLCCRCSRLCFTCIYYFLFLLVSLLHMHGTLTGRPRSLKLIIECHTADTMCLNACRYFHCKGKKDSRNWAWRGGGGELKGYAWQANTRHVTSQRHYIIRVTTPLRFLLSVDPAHTNRWALQGLDPEHSLYVSLQSETRSLLTSALFRPSQFLP